MPLIGVPIREYLNTPEPKSPPSIKEVRQTTLQSVSIAGLLKTYDTH